MKDRIKESDIKWLAAERVHDTVRDFLDQIEDLKKTAKSPSSKLLSKADEKSARHLDSVNPLFTGNMAVKAGHQIDQARQEMFDYLHLDMDDYILTQESINGPEDTVKDIFEGVLGTDDEAMQKGFYHYEMLLRKLDDLDYEYSDLWNLDDLKRETKVLMGVTKAWDKEAHKLHEQMDKDTQKDKARYDEERMTTFMIKQYKGKLLSPHKWQKDNAIDFVKATDEELIAYRLDFLNHVKEWRKVVLFHTDHTQLDSVILHTENLEGFSLKRLRNELIALAEKNNG